MPPVINIKRCSKKRDNTIYKDIDEITQFFDPKMPYYVNDYLRDIEGKEFETYAEFEEYAIRRIIRVVHRVTGKCFINFGKLNEDDPCSIVSITPEGYYSGGKNGSYYIYQPADEDDGRKKGKWVKHAPFSYLNTANKYTISRKAVCKPYHSDIPFLTTKDEFNVFSGFLAEYNKKEEELSQDKEERIKQCLEICKPLLDHIRDVWASGNIIHYTYIMEFIASIIRELKRTNQMMVIKGVQGSGKGIVADFLQRYVFGLAICKQIQGLNEITGQFNCLLRGAMLVFIDELSNQRFDRKGSNKAIFDVLKRLITGNDFRFTLKGVDSELLANLISYILFTNHDDSIFIEEEDRRAFMILISSCKVGNFKYFDDLADAIMNERVGNAFYTLCRDHPKWTCEGWDGNLRNIPETALKKDTIKSCKGKSELFFDEVFDTGTAEIKEELLVCKFKPERKQDTEDEEDLYFITEDEKHSEIHVVISVSDLYTMYKDWHRRTNNGNLLTDSKFKKKLYECYGISKYGRIQQDGCRDDYVEILPKLYKKAYVKPTSTLDYDKVKVISVGRWLTLKFNILKKEEEVVAKLD